MQIKMFTVSAMGSEDGVGEVNRFLRAVRVLSVEKHLVGADPGAFWAICVQYLDRLGEGNRGGAGDRLRPKVDYKEILSEADFSVFARLRDLRKAMAEREAVPPYSIFTNEQLASMVTQKAESLAALGQIEGIGAARLEKYGAFFLEALKTGVSAPLKA
jgi:superfamily II DNA helicase RecQ